MVALGCSAPPAKKDSPSVADALRQHAPDFLAGHAVQPHQARALEQLMKCRTQALGGQLWKCNQCRGRHFRFHSCRHRQCPTCGGATRADWLQKMLAAQLPVRYSHVVFTLPHDLLPIIALNPWLTYSLLFDVAWQAMAAGAWDLHQLMIAATMALHTWGQRGDHHPHSHNILPLGGLTAGGEWVDLETPEELIDAPRLSERFQKAYLDGLSKHCRAGELILPGSLAGADNTEAAFDEWLTPAAAKHWVVNVQTPPPHCEGAEAALKYLAGYVNGSPIGNSRIVEVTRDRVAFTFKDYRCGGELKLETVTGAEFVRRFLIHILPPRFRRVRHRGFLANPVRTARLAQIRTALGVPQESEPDAPSAGDVEHADADADTLKSPRCPRCGADHMSWQAELQPAVGWVAARYGKFARRARGAGLGPPPARPP